MRNIASCQVTKLAFIQHTGVAMLLACHMIRVVRIISLYTNEWNIHTPTSHFLVYDSHDTNYVTNHVIVVYSNSENKTV